MIVVRKDLEKFVMTIEIALTNENSYSLPQMVGIRPFGCGFSINIFYIIYKKRHRT